jgi:hypothetical protein
VDAQVCHPACAPVFFGAELLLPLPLKWWNVQPHFNLVEQIKHREPLVGNDGITFF